MNGSEKLIFHIIRNDVQSQMEFEITNEVLWKIRIHENQSIFCGKVYVRPSFFVSTRRFSVLHAVFDYGFAENVDVQIAVNSSNQTQILPK